MNTMDDTGVTESSGNLFADLELENPDDVLAKAKLAHLIGVIIARRHLNQTQTAAVLGIDQPKVSALLRGRLAGFSIERPLRFLLALDRDIGILVKPKPRRHVHGRLTVVTSPTQRDQGLGK